jgi:hypothetical protein
MDDLQAQGTVRCRGLTKGAVRKLVWTLSGRAAGYLLATQGDFFVDGNRASGVGLAAALD